MPQRSRPCDEGDCDRAAPDRHRGSAADRRRAKRLPATTTAIRRELDELRASSESWSAAWPRAESADAAERAADRRLPRFRFGRDGFVFGTADGKTELRLRAGPPRRRARLLRRPPADPRHLPHPARPPVHRGHAVRHHRLPADARLRAGSGHPPRRLRRAASLALAAPARRQVHGAPSGSSGCRATRRSALRRAVAGDRPGAVSRSRRDAGRRRRRRHLQLRARHASTARPTAPTAPTSIRNRRRTTSAASSCARCEPIKQRLVDQSRLRRRRRATAASRAAPPRPICPPIARRDSRRSSRTSSSAMTPDAAVVAAGDRWRVSPQLYWYIGPVGLLAEYRALVAARAARWTRPPTSQNRAWNLTASFVMTLERASYDGVVPKHPVDFRHKSFGAFELTLRYSELRIDPNAFPMFADPATSVRVGARAGRRHQLVPDRARPIHAVVPPHRLSRRRRRWTVIASRRTRSWDGSS